jgi:predicted  nucleic acid-binding Zn-ribbon protein
MADLTLALIKTQEAHDLISQELGLATTAERITALQTAVTDANAAKASAESALTAMTAERDALATKVANAKVEADEVVAEAQDARAKLN